MRIGRLQRTVSEVIDSRNLSACYEDEALAESLRGETWHVNQRSMIRADGQSGMFAGRTRVCVCVCVDVIPSPFWYQSSCDLVVLGLA
jgi:hypothetical protein